MSEKNKILIVDDDNRNTFALNLVLRSKGYHCLTVSEASAALSLLKADHGIAIVLLDMMIPEMDGYEALKQIRTDDATKALPVIAVTAQAMPGDREKCLEAGADDYLSKPVDVDALLTILSRYI